MGARVDKSSYVHVCYALPVWCDIINVDFIHVDIIHYDIILFYITHVGIIGGLYFDNIIRLDIIHFDITYCDIILLSHILTTLSYQHVT